MMGLMAKIMELALALASGFGTSSAGGENADEHHQDQDHATTTTTDDGSSSYWSSSIFMYNLSLGITTLVYIKFVIIILDWMVYNKRWISLIVSRKIVHIAASSVAVLFWPYFHYYSSQQQSQQCQSWRFNVLAPSLYAVQLFVKGFVIANPNDPDVRTMTRTGNPIELCYGPLLFCLVFVYVGLGDHGTMRQTNTAAYTIGALGFGDGIAPIVGRAWPYGKYRTYGGGKDIKTISGSMGMFVGTIIGSVLMKLSNAPAANEDNKLLRQIHNNWTEMIGISLVATIAEAISGQWDNIVVPLSIWACMMFVYS